jgi:hypothetical protein
MMYRTSFLFCNSCTVEVTKLRPIFHVAMAYKWVSRYARARRLSRATSTAVSTGSATLLTSAALRTCLFIMRIFLLVLIILLRSLGITGSGLSFWM